MQYAVSLFLGALTSFLSGCTFIFSPPPAQSDASPAADATEASRSPETHPACEQLAPLRDLFDGQEIDAKWTKVSNAEAIIQDESLAITISGSKFGYLSSASTHDLTANAFRLRIDAFAEDVVTSMFLGSGNLAGNLAQESSLRRTTDNFLRADFMNLPVRSIEYPAGHVYWSIREQEGMLYYGSGKSPDQIVEFASAGPLTNFPTNHVYASFGVSGQGSVFSTTVFGAVNESDPVTQYCKAATLVDGFESEELLPLWKQDAVRPCEIRDNADSQLQMSVRPGDPFCSIATTRAFDLVDSEMEFRFDPPLVTGGGEFRIVLSGAHSLSLQANNNALRADIKEPMQPASAWRSRSQT